MKIGILTLHNAFNYGAYLQAYALQKAIAKLGHEVEFINLSSFSNDLRRLRTMLSKKPAKLAFNFKKYKAFRRTQGFLNVSGEFYSKTRRHYDAIVIGSDEVWNIKNQTFAVMPEYYGYGLNSERIITYAPSASGTTYLDVADNSKIIESMRNITHFSARDKNTFEIVEKVAKQPVTMVLDPTFLVGFEEEERKVDYKGYVLVYTYQFDPVKIRKTKEFAKSRGLALVSPCFFNDWCDHVVALTPFEFLGLLRNADYVVTDTFHGTIFSVLYNKQFGTFGSEKIKVSSLLSTLGLSCRELGVVDDIAPIMDQFIDYGAVESLIDQKRTVSLNYLRSALSF